MANPNHNAMDFNGLELRCEEVTATNSITAPTVTATTSLILGAETIVAADLTLLNAITASATEINYNDITTLGTAQASKTVTTDSNGDVTGIRNFTTTGLVNTPVLQVDSVAVSPIKWVDVAVTAALLDGAGTAPVIAGVAGDQYKVREVILVGGGTNFGAGGDRLISLTDGTTVYTTIANADIEAAPAASLRWGDVKVPFLTGTSNTATVAGQALRFAYSGGTTDHGGVGSITFSVCLEKVA